MMETPRRLEESAEDSSEAAASDVVFIKATPPPHAERAEYLLIKTIREVKQEDSGDEVGLSRTYSGFCASVVWHGTFKVRWATRLESTASVSLVPAILQERVELATTFLELQGVDSKGSVEFLTYSTVVLAVLRAMGVELLDTGASNLGVNSAAVPQPKLQLFDLGSWYLVHSPKVPSMRWTGFRALLDKYAPARSGWIRHFFTRACRCFIDPRSEGLEQVCAKMAKLKHSSWEVMLNEERNLAVNKWLSLILLEPMAFGVARNFYASKASGIASGSLGDSVSDCLASKATSTINARANSLLRYVSWAKVKLTCVFPLTEHAVYAFFEDRQATAAATSFRGLLSAIAFAQHVVGLEGGDKVYTSGRVRGLASKLYMQKRKLKQRNPLRVADVILLERICCGLEGKSVQDRHAAGFFLFLLYARARVQS
eukprot:s9793_g2.t1